MNDPEPTAVARLEVPQQRISAADIAEMQRQTAALAAVRTQREAEPEPVEAEPAPVLRTHTFTPQQWAQQRRRRKMAAASRRKQRR